MTTFYERLAPLLEWNARFRQAVMAQEPSREIIVHAVHDGQGMPQFVYGYNPLSKVEGVMDYTTQAVQQLHQQGFQQKTQLLLLVWQGQVGQYAASTTQPVTSLQQQQDFITIYEALFRAIAPQRVRQHAQNCLASSLYRNFVIYDGQTPCAISSCAVGDSVAGVYNVGCLPSYQGKGFAKAALCAALSVVHSASTIFLECEQQSHLRVWYERQGFSVLAHSVVWSRLALP